MPKATKYHFLIALTTFCLCLLTFILVDQNAWPQDKTQIQTLINKLKDSDAGVRQQAAEALGKIGPEAKVAVPILIEAFEDDNIMVRSTAVVALGAIGPGAIPALIEAFKDEDIRLFAALALAEIGPAAVPSLIEILKNKKNEHYLVRSTAVVALGYIGPESKATVPVLIEAVKDKDRWIRQPAANALERLATYLRDAKATDMIKQLKAAKKALSADPDFKNQGNTVRRAVEYLEQIKPPWWVRLKEWAFKNIVTSFLALAYLLWIIIWLIVFWLHPLALLRINQAFKQLEFSPSWAGGLKLPARVAFFIGFLNYHPRVLNAWVKAYIPAARENFKKGDTYKTRKTYVPLPVYMGEKLVDNLTVGELRSTCNKDRWCVLIQGEGGLGKTTIACQLALWAMADNPSARLCEHRLMLPVLIEPSIGFDVRQDMSAFHGELHGRFQRLVGSAERLPEELFEKLLRTRRILLIIDGLSEMPSIAEAPETVRPEHKDFPVNALIITSRTKEKVGADVTIFPSRIDRDHLIPFMNAYLIGAGHHLEDSALFQACGRLADMVVDAGRDITPLLAKLYIEELIASAKAGKLPRELPGNVPDLMLSYLNNLNRDRKTDDPDNPTVHFAAKTIAWACVQRSYQPSLASKEDIIGTIDAGQSSRNLLNYLEDRLQLIRTVSPEETKVQFLLDTLSEYLAALHLLDLYGEKEEDWKNFLSEADGKEGAPEAIKGFLLAVRDCIIAKGEEAKIPNFVADELAKRSGLDIEAIKRAQKEQRIQRLINQLGFAETYDRQQAAEALRNIGPAAKAAAPALIEALKDKDVLVRFYAGEALGKIGPQAVPALSGALKDKDGDVREAAAKALGKIGPKPALSGSALKDEDGNIVKDEDGHVCFRWRWRAAETLPPDAKAAVPALSEALKDEDKDVRKAAAEALGKIGPQAVPALIEAIKDGSGDVRQKAAEALGKIGPQAKAAVPTLSEALKDEDGDVRRKAAAALEKIGPQAKAAVPTLSEALKDEDKDVRKAAAEALGKIGLQAKAAVPTLSEALKDEDGDVRRKAAAALEKIGPQAKAAVPVLSEALKDEDKDVRKAAAEALGKIGPQAVPALIEAIKDGSGDVRQKAAEALGKIGPQAKAAVPTLSEALKDEDKDVRKAAAEALGKIGPQAVPALIVAIKDEDKDVREAAAEALGKIGPQAKAAVPALSVALKDGSGVVCLKAAAALEKIGPQAKAAVPALIEALKDWNDLGARLFAAQALGKIGTEAVLALIEALKYENEDVRGLAAATLGNIGPEAKAALPALIEALKDENKSVRGPAAAALGEIGPEAKTVVPALIEALKDPFEDVRKQAAAALGKIGPNAVPVLIEAIKDKDEDVREAAAAALGEIGPEANAVPALIEALKDPFEDVRKQAAEALGKIGPEANAVPALIEAIKDKDKEVRYAAAYALLGIGPEAKAAVPALSEALKDEDKDVRGLAAELLMGIGPEAKAAVPALIEALIDEDEEIRDVAAMALGEIDTPEAQKALEEYYRKSD